MSDHVKRGATKHENREVSYEYDADDEIISVWCCTECGDRLEIRNRKGQVNYVEIGCSCGAESLDLRIADLLEFSMGSWDTTTSHKLGRGKFADGGDYDA